MGEADADVSYNAAWMGLCIFAEVSFGIIVSCMLSLPKFVESKANTLINTSSRCLIGFTYLCSRSRSQKRRLFEQRNRASSLPSAGLSSLVLFSARFSENPYGCSYLERYDIWVIWVSSRNELMFNHTVCASSNVILHFGPQVSTHKFRPTNFDPQVSTLYCLHCMVRSL